MTPSGTGAWSRRRDAALALTCAALAIWSARRAFGAPFSTDDFIGLERASGLLPPYGSPWRFLSGTAYFTLAWRAFGLAPAPYHLVCLALHGVNAALLYVWARVRGLSPAAALLGAGLFAGCRLFLTALHQASGVGELAALTFAIAALLMVERRSGVVWTAAAAALFAAALLSKESVALLPLVLLVPRPGALPVRARLAAAGALMLPAAALAAALWLSRAGASMLGGAAYSSGLGPHVLRNLVTYGAWSVDLQSLVPDISPALPTSAWLAGIAMLAATASIAFLSRKTTTAPAAGALWWLVALAPVLPLRYHSYLHYLYTPLAGLALVAGGALDWARAAWERPAVEGTAAKGRMSGRPGEKRRGPRARQRPEPQARAPRETLAWGIAIAMVAAHAGVSERLTDVRVRTVLPGQDLPYDPLLYQQEYARRVIADVGAAIGRRPSNVLFFIPPGAGHAFNVRTGEEVRDTSAAGPRSNVLETLLDQGRVIRLVYPWVARAAIARHWEPRFRDDDVFVGRPWGHVTHFGRGEDARVQLGVAMARAGMLNEARDYLKDATAVFPAEPQLRYLDAVVRLRLGDQAGARLELEELLRSSPPDSIAAAARATLATAGR